MSKNINIEALRDVFKQLSSERKLHVLNILNVQMQEIKESEIREFRDKVLTLMQEETRCDRSKVTSDGPCLVGQVISCPIADRGAVRGCSSN